jgi:CRISPR system Cascade subunit CasB
MSTFLDWLKAANDRDTRVRAILRRSLAFDPGAHPASYPYVEPFLRDEDSVWRRQCHYLVAALWALHWKDGQPEPKLSIGEAMARYAEQHHPREQLDKGSSSTERRFVALLDADGEQLSYRLRQAIALLKDESIDFEALLADLLRWQVQHKPSQQKWARDFYRTLRPSPSTDNPTIPQEDIA